MSRIWPAEEFTVLQLLPRKSLLTVTVNFGLSLTDWKPSSHHTRWPVVALVCVFLSQWWGYQNRYWTWRWQITVKYWTQLTQLWSLKLCRFCIIRMVSSHLLVDIKESRYNGRGKNGASPVVALYLLAEESRAWFLRLCIWVFAFPHKI